MIDISKPDFGNTPIDRRRPRYPYVAAAGGTPVVSIVTPYYNTGALFMETVDSVLAQSLQSWEWIVVDDGSADPVAVAALDEAARRDPRIRVARQENRGPAAARNRGVSLGTGRYIALLDSDDLIEPTFLEKLAWFLEVHPEYGFCNTWSVAFGSKEFLWTLGFETGSQHLRVNSGPAIALVRRTVWDEAGGFDEGIRHGHEDWDFWLRCAGAGHWGYTIPEYLAWYRQKPVSRFADFMAEPSRHDEFCQRIHERHSKLESSFPRPRTPDIAPFEAVRTGHSMRNPLAPAQSAGRVLFLLPWMVAGGADRVAIEWARALVGQGHEVSVAATLSATHVWQHKFEEITPDVFVLSTFLRLTDYAAFLDYLIETRGITAVVISGSTIGYHTLPYLRARHPRVAFMDLTHVEEPHWLSGGHPRFAVGYQDLLDINVVTTADLRRWMSDKGADPARIEVCYTGADVASMEPYRARRKETREELGIAPGEMLAIFVGRLTAQKRPWLLADIAKAAVDRQSPMRLVIAGDGEFSSHVAQRIQDLGVDSLVRMLGAVSHDRWLELLAASDVLVMPSDYEGVPVALYEAMAMGVIPVMSDIAGVREVVPADCGHVIDKTATEVEEFGDALSALAQDPAKRQQMSVAARARIEGVFSSEEGSRAFIRAIGRARELAGVRDVRTMSERTGTELATLGIEYSRMSNVADLLWQHKLVLEQRIAAMEAAPAPVDRRLAWLAPAQREQALDVVGEFGHMFASARTRTVLIPVLRLLERMGRVANRGIDMFSRHPQ